MKKYLWIFFSMLLFSCSKLIEIELPKNQITKEDVFKDQATLESALVNIYARFEKQISHHTKYLQTYVGVVHYQGSTVETMEYASQHLTPHNGWNNNIWTDLYGIIYQCNDIIEELPNSPLSESSISQYVAEARFLRAYAYSKLLSLFDHIPLLLSTDVQQNRLAYQTDGQQVVKQIIDDLQFAKTHLPDQLSEGKTRASKWSASALLARIYFQQKDWNKAVEICDEVLHSGTFLPLENIDAVFNSSSKETILQLWTQNGFLSESTSIIPDGNDAIPQYPLDIDFVHSFDAGDLRKSHWIGQNTLAPNGATYYYPFKYKNAEQNTSNPEYLIAFRAAELVLIRAESLAHLNNIEGAIDDLNRIRNRAGLTLINTPVDKTSLLDLIDTERSHEYFMEEWILYTTYRRAHPEDKTVFPIPQDEITYNPNLIQNEGY